MSLPEAAGVASSVASRFVSQSSLDAAKAQREADWKAAYERIGQEPPKREQEEEYDGRSLWEKLQENKNKKQEAFDEQLKFKNQFRALDEEEISFLDSLVDDDNEEEIRKQKEIKDQLAAFKASVLSRSAAPPPPSSLIGSHTLTATAPIASTSSATPTPAAKPAPKSKKKDLQKKLLGGVVLKKKASGASPSPTPPAPAAGVKRTASDASAAEGKQRAKEEGEAKKAKVDDDPDAGGKEKTL